MLEVDLLLRCCALDYAINLRSVSQRSDSVFIIKQFKQNEAEQGRNGDPLAPDVALR